MLTLEPVQGLNQKYLQAEPRSSVKYRDLRDFIAQLDAKGDLKRITQPVSTSLEMTEISDRVLRAGGPALLFENAQQQGAKAAMPVLANLFGTPQRVGEWACLTPAACEPIWHLRRNFSRQPR